MISNCSGNEYGRATGGAAGDQTGKEWAIINWYKPTEGWHCVLRHPREDVREMLAEMGERAAQNDMVGYDQAYPDRMTYWAALQQNGYDPRRISEPVETDCSDGVISDTKAVGYLLNIDTLKSIKCTFTGNMKDAYKAAGFEVLTDEKYLTSPDYLLRGDILLNEVTHTATNLTDGKYAVKTDAKEIPPVIGDKAEPVVNRDWLQRGDEGQLVKNAQALLYAHGYLLNAEGVNDPNEIDGEFGNRTYLATIKFQTDHGLVADGEIGKQTLAALNS